MAQSALRIVLNTAFFMGSTPYRFKNGRIIAYFPFYLTRKVILNFSMIPGIYFFYKFSMHSRSITGMSPFTITLTAAIRFAWIFQEIAETILVLQRNKKYVGFLNRLLETLGNINYDKTTVKRFQDVSRKIKIIYFALITYHVLFVPYSLIAFKWIALPQFNQFTYIVAVLHHVISCFTLIAVVKLLNALIATYKEYFLKGQTTRMVLREFFIIYEIPREFVKIVGEMVAVRVFVTFLVFTLGLYMQTYVNLFLASSFKTNGVRGTNYYLLASIFVPGSLILVTHFDLVAISVSLFLCTFAIIILKELI